MDFQELRREVLEVAKRCAQRGAGYSQQGIVLDEVAQKYRRNSYPSMDIKLQQAILTCWHDLFREGDLSWGYDLDNPDAPFFHVRDNGRLQAG